MTQKSAPRSIPFFHRCLCLLLAGLTACGTTRSSYLRHAAAAPETPGYTEPYRVVETWGAKEQNPKSSDPELAPGWLLTLRCLSDSKLDGEYRIDFNGDLSLPYDIKINTNGLTLSQLHKRITEQLLAYFKNPSDIDLAVKEKRYWVDVRGLVEKPARYLVDHEASLDELIGLAGGFSKETPPQYVQIHKGHHVLVLNLNQYYSQIFEHPKILGWVGGEEVFLQKEIVATGAEGRLTASLYQLPVHILGEVKKPGDYTLTPGLDFVDTLVQAGGFTDRADLDKIELIRKTPEGKSTYALSWGNLSNAPALQQGDIVMVHADNITSSERRVTLWTTVITAVTGIVTSTIFVLAYNKGRI